MKYKKGIAMRRIITLVLALVLLVVPVVTSAQDSRQLWELDGVFPVEELGFQFNYPAGWITKIGNGIRIAETKNDLAAILDDKDDTQADGYTISLNWISLDSLNLPADTKLDTLVDSVVEQSGTIETEDRVEVPVMTRRGVTIIGSNAGEKPGIATFWLQDGYLVVFGLGAPELNTKVGFSWGQILSTIQPLNTLELADQPLESPDGDFTMSYPKGWFTGEAGSGETAELESDIGVRSGTPKGQAVAIVEYAMKDFGTSVKDLDTLVVFLKQTYGLDMSTEHIILGQPAATISGAFERQGGWVEFTALILDNKVVAIGGFFPTEEAFTAFQPTYLAMLQSITPTEPTS